MVIVWVRPLVPAERALDGSAGDHETQRGSTDPILDFNSCQSDRRAWCLTMKMMSSGSSSHCAMGASPVPRPGKVGIEFAYAQRLSGPVAIASNTMVMSTPGRRKKASDRTEG